MIKPRYVEINLSNGEIKKYPISNLMHKLYIGGKGLGAKILYDELQAGIDPLSPENIFIINTGPMNGTGAPSTSRFNINTKNVLTGTIASSNCGGSFGVKLRKAGFDGLIIKGKAENPCYLEILDGEITIKDASHLWGLNAEATQQEFDSRYGCLVIGPAGENLVRYSCAVSDERVAGRCGVGAVMGSKNLKALVAYGTKEIPVYDPEGLKKFIAEWIEFIRTHQVTGQDLPRYGTAGFIPKCNASGILPTHNFREGTWDEADAISGQTLAEKYMTRNSGCMSCPIRCERRVKVGEKEVKGPEYETVALFGSNIENTDLGLINEWNYFADILGMDTISLAGTIAFAMELQERGIKDFGIHFGETSNIIEVIHKIAFREGEFSELGDGTKILSEKYGGEDFAIHSKGMELPGYEPRRAAGQGLGYAVSNRGGCHIGGGYAALLEAMSAIPVNPITTKGKPELGIFLQNALDATSAAGYCIMTLQTLVPHAAFKLKPSGRLVGMIGESLIKSRRLLRIIWDLLPGAMPINGLWPMPQAEAIRLTTGLKMNVGEFLHMGERIYNLERMFNIREGFCADDDTLPARLTDEPSDPENPDTVVKVEEMKKLYYKIRGWDENGIPTQRKLKHLGIIR